MALTHIDCFSGPGGICTGLHAAGFETLIAIEFIKSCVDTYSANHPEVHVISRMETLAQQRFQPQPVIELLLEQQSAVGRKLAAFKIYANFPVAF